MRQKILSSATVLATLLAAQGMIGLSPARAEAFDLRWAAVEPVQKSDRLGAPAAAGGSSVVFYSDPAAGLTVATKIATARNESSRKIREVPAENARQEKKKKLLVGCEPSFSPVTMPSMANVTGRCLAARDGETKFAGLAR